jgi:hypothetical protein
MSGTTPSLALMALLLRGLMVLARNVHLLLPVTCAPRRREEEMTYRGMNFGHTMLAAWLGAVLMLAALCGCDNLRPSEQAAGPAQVAQPAAAGAATTPSDPQPVPGVPGVPGDCDEKLAWNQMSFAVRTRWETLGWDQRSWNGEAPPPRSEGKAWKKLSRDQRAAAVELGCQPTLWDVVQRLDKTPG